MKLILDCRAREQRSTRGHFVENASDPPHINGGGVLRGAQEDIWRSVPEGHHLVAVGLGGDALGAGQAKVRKLKYLNINSPVDHKINLISQPNKPCK